VVFADKEGNLGHLGMRFGDSLVQVGAEWAELIATPAAVRGENTQTIHVHLKEGINPHCSDARAAGAVLLQEPTGQFYGDRTYRASDPEGHVWTFGQTVRQVSR
jgi:uncharacterized glyoxalase superfamily protein PhnB